MIVVDASVLAVALVDDGDPGDVARRRLRGEILAAPELIDLEVLSVLRRFVAAGTATADRGRHAMSDLVDLPIRRAPHRPLLGRCWELRADLTVSDAGYVALAETLGSTLITAAGRLARTPGLGCTVELVG